MKPEEPTICPRCQRPLVRGALSAVELSICSGCEGVLVEQRSLIALMEAMSAEVARDIDPYQPLEALPDDGARASCPRCGGALTRFGYLGTSLVYPSRCGGCQVIWADPGELGVMALLYARTERRVSDGRAQEAQWQEALDKRVHAILKQRVINRLIGGDL